MWWSPWNGPQLNPRQTFGNFDIPFINFVGTHDVTTKKNFIATNVRRHRECLPDTLHKKNIYRHAIDV